MGRFTAMPAKGKPDAKAPSVVKKDDKNDSPMKKMMRKGLC